MFWFLYAYWLIFVWLIIHFQTCGFDCNILKVCFLTTTCCFSQYLLSLRFWKVNQGIYDVVCRIWCPKSLNLWSLFWYHSNFQWCCLAKKNFEKNMIFQEIHPYIGIRHTVWILMFLLLAAFCVCLIIFLATNIIENCNLTTMGPLLLIFHR